MVPFTQRLGPRNFSDGPVMWWFCVGPREPICACWSSTALVPAADWEWWHWGPAGTPEPREARRNGVSISPYLHVCIKASAHEQSTTSQLNLSLTSLEIMPARRARLLNTKENSLTWARPADTTHRMWREPGGKITDSTSTAIMNWGGKGQ